jgi:hypothetical protein
MARLEGEEFYHLNPPTNPPLQKREFYLYAIKKDGADLCAIKKVSRTCVPPS